MNGQPAHAVDCGRCAVWCVGFHSVTGRTGLSELATKGLENANQGTRRDSKQENNNKIRTNN